MQYVWFSLNQAVDTVSTWTRTATLGGQQLAHNKEIWEYSENGDVVASFEVAVTVGKPLDILGLKGTSLNEIREYAGFLSRTARDIYASNRSKREIAACPCCGADTAQAFEALSVFGIPYLRCWQCGHGFVRTQPAQEVLAEVFADSEEHSATYTDRASLEIRLAQVIQPKLDWMQQVYRLHRRQEMMSVLDVGAGGGHFVEACRQAGLKAEGYELSKASRRFAREVFNLELCDADFLTHGDTLGKFDIITLWGLLEYTPEPRRFLQTARQQLDPRLGMLVVEVPRFDCVGTAIQQECPDTVARHLDPTSHVNCFSDASLATALFTSGFKPVAAWYFGMDAYELLVQLALRLDAHDALERWVHLIPGLQASLDSAQLCDDIIVAALPLEQEAYKH